MARLRDRTTPYFVWWLDDTEVNRGLATARETLTRTHLEFVVNGPAHDLVTFHQNTTQVTGRRFTRQKFSTATSAAGAIPLALCLVAATRSLQHGGKVLGGALHEK